jgi:hypothetical protein
MRIAAACRSPGSEQAMRNEMHFLAGLISQGMKRRATAL